MAPLCPSLYGLVTFQAFHLPPPGKISKENHWLLLMGTICGNEQLSTRDFWLHVCWAPGSISMADCSAAAEQSPMLPNPRGFHWRVREIPTPQTREEAIPSPPPHTPRVLHFPAGRGAGAGSGAARGGGRHPVRRAGGRRRPWAGGAGGGAGPSGVLTRKLINNQ